MVGEWGRRITVSSRIHSKFQVNLGYIVKPYLNFHPTPKELYLFTTGFSSWASNTAHVHCLQTPVLWFRLSSVRTLGGRGIEQLSKQEVAGKEEWKQGSREVMLQNWLVAHSCSPNTQDAEKDLNTYLWLSQDHIMRPCLRKKTTINTSQGVWAYTTGMLDKQWWNPSKQMQMWETSVKKWS